MIEFVEKFHADGTATAALVSDELPTAYTGKRYTYRITVHADGRCEAKSRADGNGSTRYYTFRTYPEALGHGFKWAQRKIAEAKRVAA
jgi:hypothetical protein